MPASSAIAAASALEWLRSQQEAATGGYGDGLGGARRMAPGPFGELVPARNAAGKTWDQPQRALEGDRRRQAIGQARRAIDPARDVPATPRGRYVATDSVTRVDLSGLDFLRVQS